MTYVAIPKVYYARVEENGQRNGKKWLTYSRVPIRQVFCLIFVLCLKTNESIVYYLVCYFSTKYCIWNISIKHEKNTDEKLPLLRSGAANLRLINRSVAP